VSADRRFEDHAARKATTAITPQNAAPPDDPADAPTAASSTMQPPNVFSIVATDFMAAA